MIKTWFPRRKYIVKKFREYYDEEVLLISFKMIEESKMWGDVKLLDLNIEARKGKELIKIDISKDKIYYIKQHFPFNITLSKEEFESEIFEDLETAKLVFELT